MGYAHRLEGVRQIKLEDFDPGEDAGRKEAEQKTARLSTNAQPHSYSF